MKKFLSILVVAVLVNIIALSILHCIEKTEQIRQEQASVEFNKVENIWRVSK